MFNRVRLWLYRRRLQRQLRERGWTAAYIEGSHGRAPWAYTVGFARHGWPEIVISGTSNETANAVFHLAYQKLGNGELRIAEWEKWPLPNWVTCAWRRAHETRVEHGLVHFATRDRWEQTGQLDLVEAFQLVFPDEASESLPWEDGFDEDFRSLQNEFWIPPTQAELALHGC